MKNPPKELKEKFPMCDQFLDVKWIRQFPNGGWVGTVTAKTYDSNKSELRNYVIMQRNRAGSDYKKNKLSKESIMIFDITDSDYTNDQINTMINTSKQTFSRHWEGESCTGTDGLTFDLENKITVINKTRKPQKTPFGTPFYSFSNTSMNVCVALPDLNNIWVIEHNMPFTNESKIPNNYKNELNKIIMLTEKGCISAYRGIQWGGWSSVYCKHIADGSQNSRDGIIVGDFDGDGKKDYWIPSLRAFYFINDSIPFIFPIGIPVHCGSFNYYYNNDKYSKANEENCIAKKKKEYLNKQDSIIQIQSSP